LGNVTYLANFAMVDSEYYRELIFYKGVFWNFYRSLNQISQKKLEWTLGLVRDLPVIPKNYFKSIEGVKGLYEIRVQVGNNTFRIFCCFDKEKKIVLFNGFIKKSNRTPAKEIHKAVGLKKEYFNEKRNRLQ